jgi:hypothetical protein
VFNKLIAEAAVSPKKATSSPQSPIRAAQQLGQLAARGVPVAGDGTDDVSTMDFAASLKAMMLDPSGGQGGHASTAVPVPHRPPSLAPLSSKPILQPRVGQNPFNHVDDDALDFSSDDDEEHLKRGMDVPPSFPPSPSSAQRSDKGRKATSAAAMETRGTAGTEGSSMTGMSGSLSMEDEYDEMMMGSGSGATYGDEVSYGNETSGTDDISLDPASTSASTAPVASSGVSVLSARTERSAGSSGGGGRGTSTSSKSSKKQFSTTLGDTKTSLAAGLNKEGRILTAPGQRIRIMPSSVRKKRVVGMNPPAAPGAHAGPG